MCPQAPVGTPADISLNFTDEDLYMFLDKFEYGSPLPGNVVADVNPYHYLPSNLPDGIWYFVRSEEKKDTKVGFWKAKGEAILIFSNSTIAGWRTTLEFYEGQVPHGQRTDWVMQEYKITWKGLHDNSKPKDSRSLCRVFLNAGLSPNHKRAAQHGATIAAGDHFHSMPSAASKTDSTSEQGSTSELQVKNKDDETGPLGVAERLPYPPVENLHELDYILTGDYLELNDLTNPDSRSSLSDNSSCLSMTSEECFDSLALLRDLEDEINKDLQQRKDSSFKLSVSTAVKPNEVVMPPSTLESIGTGNGSKFPVEEIVPGSSASAKFPDKRVSEHGISSSRQSEDYKNEGHNVAASSSIHKRAAKGKGKAHVSRIKKLNMKYLCFISF